ncbi:ATP-binding cassette domain-containing protein [Candidatus Bandiella numerosa]|uniref:ATP-binding cassette domain-containing protein n=1 Tax=Candidatus Bandiella numerosa TaxID=2570586 RepID=UPI00249EF58B|nr:ATP-binding cassette domain-containing protein [Candidatus Bandiella numerosa]WHA04437.1 ATP-binding cassette domain-containing protein [Candidatus Bandiella numerosa]
MSIIKDYNYIYQFIDENSHIITPTIFALAGGVTFGIPGAAMGFSSNIIDYQLSSRNITQENYFSRFFIGFTWSYTISPSLSIAHHICAIENAETLNAGIKYAIASIATIGGVLATTEEARQLADQHNISYQHFIRFSKGLVYGAFIGKTIGVFEQIILKSAPHLFSNSGMISAILSNTLITYAIGITIGMLLVNNEDNMNLNFKPLNLAQDLYSSYNLIIDPIQLKSSIYEHVEAILTSQILIQYSMIQIQNFKKDILYNYEHLPESPDYFPKLQSTCIQLFFLSIPFTLFELSSKILKSYYSTKLYCKIDDSLRNTLFTNDTAWRLASDENSTVLIDNLSKDSRTISYDGAILIADLVSKTTKGVYGFSLLIENSSDILMCSILWNQLTKYITQLISDKQLELSSKIKQQESLISTTIKYDLQNIQIINERDGIHYTKGRLGELYDTLRVYELEKDQISITLDMWEYFTSISNFVYNDYIIAFKINAGQIDFDSRANMHYASWQALGILSWGEKKIREIEKIYGSLERINLFLEKSSDTSEQYCKNTIQRITLENGDTSFVLSKISISIKNKLLLTIDHLTLNPGTTYALSGSTGSGKSSLLKKLAGKEQDSICGEGTIYYPINSKIVMVSQKDYFPLNVTLLEAIFYPDSVDYSRTEEIQKLLKKVKLTHYDLEKVENWFEVLSGGQIKILLILSAIIKYPDLLILDEAFNGLDKEDSIRNIQNLIQTYLPNNAVVISIDHAIQKNNETGFYKSLLKISNGQIYSDEISSSLDFSNIIAEQFCPLNHTDIDQAIFLPQDICFN